MEPYTENTCIANPDYGQQSAYREKGNTETCLKAWNLNFSRNSSCFFLKGVSATYETHLDLKVNCGDPLQQTTEATAATEDI